MNIHFKFLLMQTLGDPSDSSVISFHTKILDWVPKSWFDMGPDQLFWTFMEVNQLQTGIFHPFSLKTYQKILTEYFMFFFMLNLKCTSFYPYICSFRIVTFLSLKIRGWHIHQSMLCCHLHCGTICWSNSSFPRYSASELASCCFFWKGSERFPK